MSYHCADCKKDFSSNEALQSHNKSKHPERVSKPLFTHKQKKNIRTAIIVLVLLGIAWWGFTQFKAKQDVINSLDFNAPRGQIHWHPNVKIILDGTPFTIPKDIGMVGGHKPIHTHESNGDLHMENANPTKKTVTLGYFFDVWGKKFNKECILNKCVSSGTLTMTVNGEPNLDFENYFIQDKDKIVITFTSFS